MRSLAITIKNTFQNVDIWGRVVVVAFVILVIHFIIVDVWRAIEVKNMIVENREVVKQLGLVSPYPAYGDMQFPKLPSGATKTEAIQMLGIYRKIAIDSVKKRDDEIADLKNGIKK